ncbi:triose-phosphate isomerase [Riemerella anatipestifer]|uniref:Triosephosphate isomerase n=1 Tax=Riemerella anatipestifer RA-CH-1 TaxID=1228997 RepID=J9R9M0_RIEAN|nr:triose-phosphate isomerase [Riemerella anatipestifer]AFR36407.1 Triosephosphate isomerase [Riemerella anatipestifer RA-CH-1]AIH01187.1 triosephosphate isomerase [Riemerella anatipestifer CH3]MCO7331716.1 triose-phosphate isomerase [Riemerella anatipestifer]MCO7350603.1 triose-phosphate isomerase [Riemerella anatipestifer]MCQ4039148.1 triose-phosphate isomerase [Riemerella anatipestifer]
MRKNIVAGNWKMNKDFSEAQALMQQLSEYTSTHTPNCKVMIAPPALYLTTAKNIFKNKEVEVYAQDISEHESGAYTGEISAAMIASVNLDGSIIAHSERRQYHGETDSHANRKVKTLLDKGLTPIYCNGENLEERKSGKYLEVIKNQTQTALFTLSAEEIKKVVIAYEPVWAIGTGETATAEQAQEVHAFIRNMIAEKYGKEVADEVSILYGGSVKPSNAKEIFSQPDVDGGLIGGAALNIEDFSKIIEAF